MSNRRPEMRAEIKRAVRQRCGFGCVICGIPLYHYDHLLGYAVTQRHEADEITLLCARHHDEKTRGVLPPEKVSAANQDPWNPRHGVTSPYQLHFGTTEPAEMVIASDSFTSEGDLVPIVVDNEPLLAFSRSSGELALHLTLRDRHNWPWLVVVDNELVLRQEVSWDVQFEGQALTLREAPGRVVLRIRFDPPRRVVVERARLMSNGVIIEVNGSSIQMGGRIDRPNKVTFSGNRHYGSVGITIGYCPDFPAPPILRYNVDRYPPGAGEVLG
jgi:hypothetical protein